MLDLYHKTQLPIPDSETTIIRKMLYMFALHPLMDTQKKQKTIQGQTFNLAQLFLCKMFSVQHFQHFHVFGLA
jgi:hypothetical protein